MMRGSKRKSVSAELNYPRKMRKQRIKPIDQAIEVVKTNSHDKFERNLDIKFISAYKGYGVFAKTLINGGEFIAKYRGETITFQEGEQRLRKPGFGSFLFFIGKKMCVDATKTKGKGKLINDSVERKLANCIVKNHLGHLFIFAARDIQPGEELTYYYGDTESNMYWRLGHEPDRYFSEVDKFDTIEHCGTDEDVEIAENIDNGENCGKGEDGESIKSVTTAENCDTDQDGEISETHVTARNCNIVEDGENIYTAGKYHYNQDGKIVKNIDKTENCYTGQVGEKAECIDSRDNYSVDKYIYVADTAGICGTDKVGQIAEIDCTAGNCDIDEDGVIAENNDNGDNFKIIKDCENVQIVDTAENFCTDKGGKISDTHYIAGDSDKDEYIYTAQKYDKDKDGDKAETEHTSENIESNEICENVENIDSNEICQNVENIDSNEICENVENIDPAETFDKDKGGEIVENIDTAEAFDIDMVGEIVENIDIVEKTFDKDKGCEIVENIDIFEKTFDKDKGGEIVGNIDIAENFDKDEGGEVAENIVTTENFDLYEVGDNSNSSDKYGKIIQIVDTPENFGTDEAGQLAKTNDTALNCDINERGDILKNIYTAKKSEICKDDEMVENIDTAWNSDKDGDDEGAETGDADENCNYDEGDHNGNEISPLDFSDEENDMDDSFDDPSYVPEDNDTSEEENSANNDICKYQPSIVNNCGKLSKPTKKKTISVFSNPADLVPNSDDSCDSCESAFIPKISSFLSQENRTASNENHTSGYGLHPKKPVKEGCKQVYDKINYCTFCKKGIKSKISRHLLAVHKSESKVIDILILPKRSKERVVKLEILSNEGNFKHNIEVLKSKEGFLVVGRRENNFKVGNYLPCDFCKKFILKATLWLHHKNCSVRLFKNNSNGPTNETKSYGNAVRLSRQLLNSALLEEPERNISMLLSRMQHDEISEEVQNDALIKRYAALKVNSLGRQQDQKINDMHRVSQSCRTLARLVIGCRAKSEHIVDLNRLISPINFDLVVSTTKSMCHENGKASPSLGKLVGNNLAHVIQVKKGVALRKDDDVSLRQAENFQKLFTAEWNFRVNAFFQKMTNTINRQKSKTIPLTEDLQKLRNYMLKEMKNESASLQKEPCAGTWTRLAKLTLSRLILFNKRRRAEVKDLKLKEFEARPDWQNEHQGEFQMALTTSDRMLAERMDMVISAGKSKKNVDAYVIMPPDTKQAVNLLNSSRHSVGIATSNPFIFARVNSDSPLSGNTDLKEIVEACPGLQHPERITSTGLRRYIGTVSQILDMSNTELESLARHLGHDVQTHKQNYRLSNATRELTVVSQLLIAVDSGMVNKWKGKSLADISVDELPDVLEDDSEHYEDCTSVDAVERQSLPKLGESNQTGESSLLHDVPNKINSQDCTSVDAVERQSLPKLGESNQTGESSLLHAVPNKINSQGKRSIKQPWSQSVEAFLRKTFKQYLNRVGASLHNSDIILAQQTCMELSCRSLAQIRSKLNNMKLGKSK